MVQITWNTNVYSIKYCSLYRLFFSFFLYLQVWSIYEILFIHKWKKITDTSIKSPNSGAYSIVIQIWYIFNYNQMLSCDDLCMTVVSWKRTKYAIFIQFKIKLKFCSIKRNILWQICLKRYKFLTNFVFGKMFSNNLLCVKII